MQRKWGIAQKGLILISAPLAFELLFLFVVGAVLAQTQIELEDAGRSRQIVACADDVGRLIVNASTLAGASKLSQNKEIHQRYRKIQGDLLRKFDELDDLLAHKPDAQKSVRQSKAKTIEAISELDKVEFLNGSLQSVLNSKSAHNLSEQTTDAGKAMVSLLQSEEAHGQNSAVMRKTLMFRLQVILALGFLVNAGITVWLASFFWRGVSARLHSVMSNSQRLASRAPLAPVISGADEIAQLDQVLHEAVAELKQLEKKKRALTSAISQRLELPLREVHTITDSFLSGEFGPLDERTNDRLQSAATSSERLMRLIEDLRGPVGTTDSTGFEMRFRQANLASLIKSALSTVEQPAAARNVRIETRLNSGITLHADRDRLIQVFVNLLSNALKFTPNGSTILVTTELSEGFVSISFKDQGPGIDKRYHEKIFGLFEQVHAKDASEKGGSGLGLVICKNIVRRHRGLISLDSELGQGSTFIVHLPLRQPANCLHPIDAEAGPA